MLNLSDRYASSNGAVQKEQSRFLAYSGWNLALEQLQLYGAADEIVCSPSCGEITVTIEPDDAVSAVWNINAEGKAGLYRRSASGTVQCFLFPFDETKTWQVSTAVNNEKPSILLLDTSRYLLGADCSAPLGITSTDGSTVCVEIADTISAETLYIYGDLIVHEEAALMADEIYVSGNISGAEQIQCNRLYSGYTDGLPYQIRVLERTVG